MSETMIALMGEVQEKDELIDQLTAERDSFKTCFDIVAKENERLRRKLEQTHRSWVAAARERETAVTGLRKIRSGSGETLRAIEPVGSQAPNERMPSAVIFNR